MANVTIDPTKGAVSVNVSITSMQVVGISINVFGSDGITQIEQYSSDSNTKNPFNIVLANGPASYKDCYVCGTFTIIDPDGAGNNYTILFSIQQGGVIITPNTTITGKTAQGQLTRVANFKIQLP